MKNSAAAFVVGLIFAIGLGVSGMTQPEKVIRFLDIFGDWDPSLAFVMAGAVAVHSVAYWWIRKRPSPLLSTHFHVPTSKELTPSLISGAFIFGVGWGLAGYCPGPSITSIASLTSRPVIFTACMLMGMLTFRIYKSFADPNRS